jgi:hypothetical protein
LTTGRVGAVDIGAARAARPDPTAGAAGRRSLPKVSDHVRTLVSAAFRLKAPAVVLVVYWACVLALFVALRLNISDAELNIDELIPVRISEGMSARGDLDPNWRFADLPWFWNFDQYNFYLYNVVAHGVLKIAAWVGASALPALRLANVFFQLLALAFSLDALRRIGAGHFVLALAGAFLAVAPGMVQDAAMARPESLLYLLVALQIWILTLRLSDRWSAVLFGVVLGLGIAVKATYAVTAVLFVVPAIVTWRERPAGRSLGALMLLGLGTAIGIVAGAPYAVLHPDAYLKGIASLTEQYNSGQPPHSRPSHDVGTQALWIGRYFVELYGLVPLAAIAAPFLLSGRARSLAAAFVVLSALLFVYFAGKAVFYERNFSITLIPMLLAAALAAAVLRTNTWRAVAAVVLMVPMAYWSVRIAGAVQDRDSLARFESANALSPSQRMSFADAQDKIVPARCDTIAVIDHNDPWTVQYLALLEAEGFRRIARYRSRFGALVTSTLHTYLDSDMHYLRCPESKR